MPRLVERAQICVGIKPVDLAGGANNGDWVSMKGFGHLSIILVAEAGVAGEDLALTLQQATAVAGTGAKGLNFTEIHKKQGADLFAVGTFTKETQAAGSTHTDAASGEVENLYVLEIDAEDLDVSGGFDCVRLNVADTGATAGKFGACIYVLSDPRYPQETPESAIVD